MGCKAGIKANSPAIGKIVNAVDAQVRAATVRKELCGASLRIALHNSCEAVAAQDHAKLNILTLCPGDLF